MSRPATVSSPPLSAWWSGFAGVLGAYLITAFGVAWITIAGAEPDAPATTIAGTYLQDAALFGTAVLLARRLGRGPALRALGWGPVVSWQRAVTGTLLAGAGFYAVSVIYGAFVSIQDPSGTTVESLGLNSGTIAVVAATPLLTVVAPLAEETMFRGLLFGALWRWRGWAFGAVVSGITFGGIHAGGAATEALPVLALFGFVLAALYRWTGSLLPSIGLHAFNNALTLAITLSWSAIGTAAVILASVLSSVSIAWLVVHVRAGRSAPRGPAEQTQRRMHVARRPVLADRRAPRAHRRETGHTRRRGRRPPT